METSISFDDFLRVELKVGRIIRATPLEGARKPAYLLHLDFGEPIGQKKSTAQITAR